MLAKRKDWGAGKREVLLLKGAVLDELERGLTVTEIFELLTSQGKMTVKYRTFAYHVKEFRKEIEAPTPASIERKRHDRSMAVIDDQLERVRKTVATPTPNGGMKTYKHDTNVDVKYYLQAASGGKTDEG